MKRTFATLLAASVVSIPVGLSIAADGPVSTGPDELHVIAGKIGTAKYDVNAITKGSTTDDYAAKGSIAIQYRSGYWATASVTCLRVDGDIATVGGLITKASTKTPPADLGDLAKKGHYVELTVQDGQIDDLISPISFIDTDPATCGFDYDLEQVVKPGSGSFVDAQDRWLHVDPTPAPTDEPTPEATPEPTASATPEPTATATPEPTATATPEPTPTPSV